MQLKLTLKTTGESWILQPNKEYIIGRDESCDITLPTVVTISFHHLKVLFNHLTNQWHIEDLNSSNGTFVYNQRIRNAAIEGITDITLSHEVHLVAVPEVESIATLVSPNVTVISPSTTSANTITSFNNPEPQSTIPKKRRKGFPLKAAFTRLTIGGVLITGLFSAIVAPSFLNQANKAKQSEGKQFLGGITRAQTDYYGTNSRFAANLDELQYQQMANRNLYYVYSVYPIGSNAVQQVAMPKRQGLRTYASISAVTSGSLNASAIMCESIEISVPTNFLMNESALSSTNLTCPPGFVKLDSSFFAL
jgi:type IV pilus assembly protein PilA